MLALAYEIQTDGMSPAEREVYDEWLDSPTPEEQARLDAADEYARQVINGAG